jgi:organic radical activating enzyme
MQTINPQPIEKIQRNDGTSLDIHSIFLTIQGEGPFTGQPAVFVRLAGCNLQCPSCDTDYTNGRREMIVERVLDEVYHVSREIGNRYKPLVVITGGEPFRQNIHLLCALLVNHGYRVQIETNGTASPTLFAQESPVWSKVTIVCSPKAGRINPWILERATCLKYVMSHDSVSEHDGLPILALNHSAAPTVARADIFKPEQIYLQPCDSKDEAVNKLNMKAVVDSCIKFGYTLQIQTHKVLGVE